jgi:hypothetical protein
MADARHRRFRVIAIVAIGCLAVAGGFGLRSIGVERSPLTDAVRVVKGGLRGMPATPGTAGATAPSHMPLPTLDWLAGTWSRRDNKGASGNRCDLASVITYLTSGYYVSPAGSGHYALDGATIIIWGRITFDDEAGADRSHVDERSVVPVTRLGGNAMRSQGAALYRCDKAANDRIEVAA